MGTAGVPPDPAPPKPPELPPRLVPRPPQDRSAAVLRRRLGTLVRLGIGDRQQVAMQILGRVLLHAALVGAAAGLLGSLFVAGLEIAQRFLLEGLTGYLPLKAAGELVMDSQPGPWRPWLLWVIPAVGALLGGAISTLAPETRGGGSDAIINAFHNE